MSKNIISVLCAWCSKPFATSPHDFARGRVKHCSVECRSAATRSRSADPAAISLRFWRQVDKGGPVPKHQPGLGCCWLWTGMVNGHGYGRINISGRKRTVNRVSWELAHGAIAEGCEVCHRCDNPRCVRVDHLFLGTRLDNMRDMARKKRSGAPLGSASGKSKLTEPDIISMRTKRAQGMTYTQLANLFGVDKSTVRMAVLRKTWRHVA